MTAEGLSPESLEDIARSAASTGNDAAAWLQLPENEGKIRKSLRGNPVTFQFEDITEQKHKTGVLMVLKEIYKNGGLEKLFSNNIEKSLIDFWNIFFSLDHEKRSERHISKIENGSAAKRLNLFLNINRSTNEQNNLNVRSHR